jgi:hypothetical protein
MYLIVPIILVDWPPKSTWMGAEEPTGQPIKLWNMRYYYSAIITNIEKGDAIDLVEISYRK